MELSYIFNVYDQAGRITVKDETIQVSFRFVIIKIPGEMTMYGIDINKDNPYFKKVWEYLVDNIQK